MRIIHLKKVNSTQDYLKKIIKDDEEIFVFSNIQTKGRGRGKNTFYSPQGGIYLSFYLPYLKDEKKLFLVSSLSVLYFLKDLLKGYNYTIFIRIPNDIIVNNKKISGILIEKFGKYIICGMGININIKEFPDEIKEATSLYLITGKFYDINILKEKLVHHIKELSYFEYKTLYEIYKNNIPTGKKVRFIYENKIIEGELANVLDDFYIEVKTSKNKEKFNLFEIFNFRMEL